MENIEKMESSELRMQYLALGSEIVGKRQSFLKATVFGCVAMILCATLWCAISVVTDYQIGFMALGLGAVVAFTVRFQGNGLDSRFAYLGGFLSLVGCILGNTFIVCYLVQSEYDTSWVESFVFVFSNFTDMISGYFTKLDLFFYAFAFYIGFRFSMERYSGAELEAIGKENYEN